LLAAEVRRRTRPRETYGLRYGRGTVFLSHDDYAIDWESFKFVVVDQAYPGDYTGAVVLDLGAHKGYYAAYALEHGARTVISFEPAAANVELLERSATSYRQRGADWRVRPVALGADRGEAELHLMASSWAHALHPPDAWAEYEVGTQSVPVEATADVLAEGAELAGESGRLVVKVNTEGEECAMVLGTPADAWRAVSELFVEVHPWAACGEGELVPYLERAGLRRLPSAMEPVVRLHREAVARDGRCSAPS
jgi:FkbM family methyltransferase